MLKYHSLGKLPLGEKCHHAPESYYERWFRLYAQSRRGDWKAARKLTELEKSYKTN